MTTSTVGYTVLL